MGKTAKPCSRQKTLPGGFAQYKKQSWHGHGAPDKKA
jgi:hypothetical protein